MGLFKKKKQKQARPIVTDVSAVKIGSSAASADNTVVSRSYAEVVDLLCEGSMEGLVSGNYKYIGEENATGYKNVNFKHYQATGALGSDDNNLGFLQSIFWNEIPVVDNDGFYNFSSVNVEYVKGNPAGNIPSLNPAMSSYAGVSATTPLDLTINRSIGERLYGPEIKGGDATPTSTKPAQLKDGITIDKYAKTYSILNKEVGQIDVNIKISALFESVQAGPKTYKKRVPAVGFGDTKARTIEYNIYHRPIFDARFSNTSETGKTTESGGRTGWSGPLKEKVTGKIDSPYIRTSSIVLQSDFSDQEGFEGWEIRIVRITPESLTSFLKNVTFVDSLVEVYRTKLRYPYSSMVYSQFDARSFSRIPSRSYDVRMTKVKIPNNYDPILKSYGNSNATNNTKTNSVFNTSSSDDYTAMTWSRPGSQAESFWDGEFKRDANGQYLKEWTDNPAWCLYDLMTNSRYGLGEFIDQSQIDKWTIYEIAQYCDVLVPDTYGSLEPRFTINYILTSREEAFKVLNDLTSIFRGIAYYSNGSIFAVQDKLKDAVYQFNNSNVIDGNFTYSSSSQKARHSVAIVRYNDKKNLFQPAIEYLEDEESVRRYGIREIETSALGATSRGQARRFAKWILSSESEETETVSFSVGNDGAYLMPGDVIQIYDNFRSPLKYSGRTNAVRPLTATNSPGATVTHNSAYNSIILDQALNFTAGKTYKFSLLTPTYNTTTGDATDIRRSQIQNLLFNGTDATTISGDYRSDLQLSGSGVCTEIYFSTGATYGGTGNQLDFSNYVITGYTNTGVATNINANTVQDYSGGCYSGENLIWCVEPNDPNDPEFIEGNYSNFKIINIKEEETNTYGVSALAYSTGKYDKIFNSAKLTSDDMVNPPLFPTGVIGSTDSTNPLANSLAFEVKDGNPDPVNIFKTIEINFNQAGYTVTPVEAKKSGSPATYKIQRAEGDTVDDIDYYIGFTKENLIVDAATQAEYGLPNSMINGSVYVVDPSKFTAYKPYVRETLNSFDKEKTLDEEVYAEYMVTDIPLNATSQDYFVFVFASSLGNDISYGMVSKITVNNTESITQSIVGATVISNLNEDEVEPAQQTSLNAIESIEPSFSWSSVSNTIFNIAEVNESTPVRFPLSIPNDLVEFRITVRPHSETNQPSEKIYLEVTGYTPQTDPPSFVLERYLNNPNDIEKYFDDDFVTGWANGSPITNWENLNLTQKKEAEPEFLSVSGSGFNISANPSEFPVRKFDIVVEAHDSNGITSAKNKVFDNTLYKSEAGNNREGCNISEIDKQYDVMGVEIQSPSGVLFAQDNVEEYKSQLSPFKWIEPWQAHVKKMPYAARAAIYPNGYFEVAINEAESPQGATAFSPDEVENFFDNSAGVIYYFTTGDNKFDESQTPQIPKNLASSFELNITPDMATEGATLGANATNVLTYSKATLDGDNSCRAFGGIVKELSPEYKDKNVWRGYYLFGEDQDIYNFRIPIPKIRQQGGAAQEIEIDGKKVSIPATEVENIQISFGIFDELSLLSSFDVDNTNNPKTYNTSSITVGADTIPLKTDAIYKDFSINFSSVVDAKGGDTYYQIIGEQPKNIKNEATGETIIGFKAQNSPRSFPLNESSIMSAGATALAFRGWAQVEFDFSSLQSALSGGYLELPLPINGASYNGIEKWGGMIPLQPTKILQAGLDGRLSSFAQIKMTNRGPEEGVFGWEIRYVLRVENVGDDSVFANFENTTGGTGHYREEWFDDQGNLYISPGTGQFGITINSAGAIFLSSEYMAFHISANRNNRSIEGIKAAIKRITGKTENVNSASILFSDILFVDLDPEGRSATKYQSAVVNTKFGILAED
jgi:hypothetical protein